MTYTLNLNQSSLTVEVGCNDGYLLQWMTTPCYGIEPTGTRGRCARARPHGAVGILLGALRAGPGA